MLTWIRKSISFLNEPAALESITREFDRECESYVENKEYSVWDKLDITEDEYQFILNNPDLICLVPYCRSKGWFLPGKILEFRKAISNAYYHASDESDVRFQLTHYHWGDDYFTWLHHFSGHDRNVGSVKSTLENDSLAIDMVVGFIDFMYNQEYE